MAGRIQGITVEIGGDTTKLQTALKGAGQRYKLWELVGGEFCVVGVLD